MGLNRALPAGVVMLSVLIVTTAYGASLPLTQRVLRSGELAVDDLRGIRHSGHPRV